MVEPRLPFVEGFRPVRIRKLVDPDQGLAAKEPNDMMKRARIFIDNRLGLEELLVPGSAPTKVGDGQRHMGDTGELGHDWLLSVAAALTIAPPSSPTALTIRYVPPSSSPVFGSSGPVPGWLAALSLSPVFVVVRVLFPLSPSITSWALADSNR